MAYQASFSSAYHLIMSVVADEAPVLDDQWFESLWFDSIWLNIGVILSIAFIIQLLVRYVAFPIMGMATQRSKAWWDDIFHDAGVLHRVGWLVPLIFVHFTITLVPKLDDRIDDLIKRVTLALMVIAVVSTISATTKAFNSIYVKALPEVSRRRPIKGFLQVVTLISYIIGALLFIAFLLDKSPWLLMSGLGAMTAVLLLVFRDTILSFVAGVQLTVNGLAQVGDWIEMPQFGADGDVIDISLNVVQVQNWDKTITAIPAHRFLEHSFKNWRGMSESGGRRIARSIDLDVNSIRFVDDELRTHLSSLQLLQPYLTQRTEEIEKWNKEHNIDTSVPGNGRRMTNVGCFRAYVIAFLKNHGEIRKDMTLLVRQQAPGPTGLPLQVYVFTNTTVWGEYERIQGDIFDHLYAILPYFQLRSFQHPSGNDVRGMNMVTSNAAVAASTTHQE